MRRLGITAVCRRTGARDRPRAELGFIPTRCGGYREIHTSNTRENVAMVKLNESLGYVIVESWGGYELALIPSSP